MYMIMVAHHNCILHLKKMPVKVVLHLDVNGYMQYFINLPKYISNNLSIIAHLWYEEAANFNVFITGPLDV